MNNCEKCGNPQKMYWCDNCESNQEKEGECDNCGHAQGITYVVTLDEGYHEECNYETIQLQGEGIAIRHELDATLSKEDWVKLNRLIEIELLLEAECNK